MAWATNSPARESLIRHPDPRIPNRSAVKTSSQVIGLFPPSSQRHRTPRFGIRDSGLKDQGSGMRINIRHMKRTLLVLAFIFTVGALTATVGYQPAPQQPAELVLTNGKIVTVETAGSQAQAVAVRGDRIVALGSSAEVKRHIGPSTQVIDLRGQLVIPGFIEGHGHFTGVGTAELQLKLMKTQSWDEIVAMVAAAAKTAKPGQWIRGRGWHQEKWKTKPQPNVEGFPTHHSLSAVSPNNPVYLTHAS